MNQQNQIEITEEEPAEFNKIEYIKNMNYANIFLNRISNRIRKRKNNKNWLGIMCGQTGSGKSYASLTIAHYIGKKVFTVFNSQEMLELINSGKVNKGSVIVFDEAGVGMSSRDWYTVQNKVLASVLQTFRNMNVGVLFTTPNISYIDSSARKLFHNYFETDFIDRKTSVNYIKVYDIQYNSKLDKTYYKHPRILTNFGMYKVNSIGIPIPSNKVCEEYEKRKWDYTRGVNRMALKSITKINSKTKEKDNEGIIDSIINDIAPMMTTYRKRTYLDCYKIMHKYNLSISNARNIVKIIKNKLKMRD
jgi:hypothetical protein